MRYEDFFREHARDNIVIARLLSHADKLGDKKDVTCFNLPLETCIGASPVCMARCYVHRSGSENREEVQRKAARNCVVAQRPDFAGLMIGAILRARVGFIRVHDFGDFFSASYVLSWVRVATVLRHVRFWAYTRSWVSPDLVPSLTTLAAVPNFRLLLSCDRSMPVPPAIPHAPLCWLADTDHDVPPFECLVVFRATAEKHRECHTLGGQRVCPYENGTETPITCVECRICLRKGD